ncbi:methyltransferase domain-containing protein [Chloroflexota bacterium]
MSLVILMTMKEEHPSYNHNILPVPRSKDQAIEFYDRTSKIYDYITGSFERKYAQRALNYLSVKDGEIVLEIGFGTGHILKRLAESVGETGKAIGVDISSECKNLGVLWSSPKGNYLTVDCTGYKVKLKTV